MTRRRPWTLALVPVMTAALLATACPDKGKGDGDKPPERIKVGLVTDVGGRGDKSFNDSALRGLEMWAANRERMGSSDKPLSAEARERSIPRGLVSKGIEPLDILPLILESKRQEDYEPNLQQLIDEGSKLVIGVGFMLENAIESAARKNPDANFLLVDSPILDPNGQILNLKNVRSVTFREHEGAFLIGAITGLVTKTHRVGFVGGMQLPLIRRFEVGFRAGIQATNPRAASNILVAYTGSFDRVDAGKQVAQDMFAKGADIVFHAAGGDGLGVIAAAKEAGAGRFAIGCDSDQHSVAPEAILTSLIKHVDLVVYEAAAQASKGEFTAGHIEVGLEQGALGYAPIRNSAFSVPEREHLIKQVHIFEQQIISGKIRVPSTLEELNAMNISQGISSKGAAPLAAPVLQTAAKPQEEGTTTQGEGTAAAAPAQEAPAAIEPAVEPAAQE